MASRQLALRRPDVCSRCDMQLAAGVTAFWDAEARVVRCLRCPTDVEPSDDGRALSYEPAPPKRETGAGRSAQQEFDRRHSAREERVRARHPRIGGLLLAVVDDPYTTKVWAQGAEGERAVGVSLDELTEAIVLHDRRLRRPDGRLSRANIDHLVVAATGVWVVDAKTHQGRLEVRRHGGLFGPRVERLFIRGRDQTALVESVQRQAATVAAALELLGESVLVRGSLCFVGTELPWLDEDVMGVPVRGRRGLAKLLRRPGPLDASQRERIAAALDVHFPSA